MDFIQNLDPSKLILAETLLSFVITPFVAPSYNFPLFLFGTYAQESTEALRSSQMFIGMLGASTLLDIIWMSNSRNDQAGFVRFLTILLLLLKIPTFLACGVSLRQRGTNFPGLGGHDLNSSTVWSMPGGLVSGIREGYQTVNEDAHVSNPMPPPTLANKQSTVSAPGAYQTA